jgi:fucose 4-O-acetylase-like acetyltransferase
MTPRRRDVALDALRLLAVLLMIASHTTRLIAWDERRAWSWFSLLIEPFTASLFLILVGASLVLSWRAARAGGRSAWFRKQALRALGLWAISVVFYALEEGFRWPDVATMSGILATIAYVSLLGMFLVASPRPAIALSLAAAACMGAQVWLDRTGTMIFGINAGNSPLLPLFPLACLGGLGVLFLECGWPWRIGLAAAAAAIVAALTARFGFAAVFSTPLGRYETARILEWMEHGKLMRKEIPYYNLRPILVPMIASLTVLLYAVFSLARPGLERGQRFFLAMGRRSLDVYILHLAILALFVVEGGRRPLQKAWQGDVVVLGAIAASWLWVMGRDAFAARKR